MEEASQTESKSPSFQPDSWLNISLTIAAILYNLGTLAIALLWLFTNTFLQAKEKLGAIRGFEINENVTYGLFLSGLMGGSFYCLRAIYTRLADTFTPQDDVPRKTPLNMPVWIFWYLYRPIEGGVLALVLMMLVKSNFFQLQESSSIEMSSYYTLVGIGFLAGFGAHELIHKILEIIQVLFAKSKVKPSSSKEKAKENFGD